MSVRSNARAYVSRLKALSRVPSRVSNRYAAALRQIVLDNWDAGLAPDGTPWPEYSAGSIAIGRGATPKMIGLSRLGESGGGMRASVTVVPLQGAGVALSIGEGIPYIRASGFRRAPHTSWLRVRGGMPAAWQSVLRDMIVEEWELP